MSSSIGGLSTPKAIKGTPPKGPRGSGSAPGNVPPGKGKPPPGPR